MVEVPYTLAGREIPDLAGRNRSEIRPAPCVFCGRAIRHFNDAGTGWLLGAVVDGESRMYLRCIEGPCSRASAPWIWRCGCSGHHVENVGDRCHQCRRPRGQAEPYDRVECPVCGAGPLAGRPARDRQRAVPVVHRRAGLSAGVDRRPGRDVAGDLARRRLRGMRSFIVESRSFLNPAAGHRGRSPFSFPGR